MLLNIMSAGNITNGDEESSLDRHQTDTSKKSKEEP